MKLNVRYSAGSLSIRYTPVEGTMLIDPETIRNLELVGNMGNSKSTHSLFGCVMPQGTGLWAKLNSTFQRHEPHVHSHGGSTPES